MKVVITRAREDGEAFGAELVRRGYEVLLEPLLSVEYRASAARETTLTDVQAILFTSANGVRAYAHARAVRPAPAYCVGAATAEAARSAGFQVVREAEGDVRAFTDLVDRDLDRNAGRLLHVAAEVVAGDLAGDLAGRGFQVSREVLYRTRPAKSLSADFRALVGEGAGEAPGDGSANVAVTLFSPRTATIFADLLRKARLEGACRRWVAVCLSEAVAEQARTLPWLRVRVAARPTRADLLASLDKVASTGQDDQCT